MSHEQKVSKCISYVYTDQCTVVSWNTVLYSIEILTISVDRPGDDHLTDH